MKYVIRFLLAVFALIFIYYVINRFGNDFLIWIKIPWTNFTSFLKLMMKTYKISEI